MQTNQIQAIQFSIATPTTARFSNINQDESSQTRRIQSQLQQPKQIKINIHKPQFFIGTLIRSILIRTNPEQSNQIQAIRFPIATPTTTRFSNIIEEESNRTQRIQSNCNS